MEDLGKEMLYLSRRDVESLDIPIADIIARLEMMFVEKGNRRVEMPPKPAVHTNGDAFLHAMPAFIPELDSAGMKWVGGYPENYKLGLPYITGLLVLNDTETGVPYAVMDCTWITAIRTAAATALTARYLARPDSRTLAILGCGVQGRYNLETLNTVFSLSKVKAYDSIEHVSRCYAREMGSRFDLDIEIAEGPREAVDGADIIVTAGPFLMDPKPVIPHEWIKPGALVCPLDLDSYVKPEVFIQSDFLCTDDLNQFNHFKANGLFKTCPESITEFCDVVTGAVEGRENDSQVITAINIGIALEDMAVAPMVYAEAIESDIGLWLDL
jgi:ornithine cyclodeaminase/alanine dehydrogenase-like protein (mu-crystallin family)